MSLDARKPRPLTRVEEVRDARLIVIATEGEKTEKYYFQGFRSTRLKLHIIECVDGESAPQHVFGRMEDFKAAHHLNEDDEFWLVIDVDRWKPKTLSEIAQECLSKSFKLAVSKPCFEIWLYFHFSKEVDEGIDSKDMEKLLKTVHPEFKKNNPHANLLCARIDTAIQNAIDSDVSPDHRWPNREGTRVYKIAQRLKEIDPDIFRI